MKNFIHPEAILGEGSGVGYFSVLEEGVRIGKGVRIGNSVTVYKGTVIGDGVQIDDNSVIGKQPRVAATSTLKKRGDLTGEPLPPLEIGNETTVGASCVLYAGSRIGKKVMVADLASIREKCAIGDCVIVGRGVTIENQCSIGAFSKLQAEVYITALTTIEDRVFIAPTVSTTNDNFMGRTEERFKWRKGPHIKSRARIGGNAVLLPGVTIGAEAVVGAGSVVTRDVPDYKMALGVPARVIRDVPDEQLLEPRIKPRMKTVPPAAALPAAALPAAALPAAALPAAALPAAGSPRSARSSRSSRSSRSARSARSSRSSRSPRSST